MAKLTSSMPWPCSSWESVVLGVWNRQHGMPQCACQETAAEQGQHRHDRQRSEVRALKLRDHELRLCDRWTMPTAGRWRLSLLGWWPSLLYKLDAVATRLEAIASRFIEVCIELCLVVQSYKILEAWMRLLVSQAAIPNCVFGEECDVSSLSYPLITMASRATRLRHAFGNSCKNCNNVFGTGSALVDFICPSIN